MKKLYLIAMSAFFVFTLSTESDLSRNEETFVISKKTVQNRSAGHLKEELGVLLEELAHLITEQIELLAQAQKQLLLRMRELVDGDAKGCFSGATHKKLQQSVLEAQKIVAQSQANIDTLIKLINFLKGI